MKLTARNRRSNFEVLRLLAIFLIVSFHSVHHNPIYLDFSLNVFFVNIFEPFGEIGVNLFFLITGYFQINGHFKPKKVMLMYCELIFYVVLTNIIAALIDKDFILVPTEFLKSIIFPDYWYWFFSAYIIIICFSPFINIFIKSLSKFQFFSFLLTCIFIYSLLPTFLRMFFSPHNSEDFYYFSKVIWAFIVYCIGAFFSMHKIRFFNTKRNSIVLGVTCFSILAGCIAIVSSTSYLSVEPSYFGLINNLPLILLSISIFNLFSMWELKQIRIINILSSTTLGIYLLHEGALRSIIWNESFKEKLTYSAARSVAAIVGASLIIIIVGIIIDLIRQIIEKYTIAKILNSPRLNQKCNSLKEHCVKKIQAFIS